MLAKSFHRHSTPACKYTYKFVDSRILPTHIFIFQVLYTRCKRSFAHQRIQEFHSHFQSKCISIRNLLGSIRTLLTHILIANIGMRIGQNPSNKILKHTSEAYIRAHICRCSSFHLGFQVGRVCTSRNLILGQTNDLEDIQDRACIGNHTHQSRLQEHNQPRCIRINRCTNPSTCPIHMIILGSIYKCILQCSSSYPLGTLEGSSRNCPCYN